MSDVDVTISGQSNPSVTISGQTNPSVTINTIPRSNLSGQIASNDAELTALNTATGALSTATGVLDTATGVLDTSVSSLQAATGVLSTATGALDTDKAPISDPTFAGNVILGNTTNNTKKFTKQKSYGNNGVVEIQRGTSTDDQLTLSWDGPTASSFSIRQHITGAAQGQIKFAIADNGDNKIRLDAENVDIGTASTALTKLFSNTNIGANKKLTFVDSRNKNHGLHFKHSNNTAPTFQLGMAGELFNDADFAQFKITHTTSAGVTENVIVVDKDNGYTKLESDRTEMKNAKITGYTQVGSFNGASNYPTAPAGSIIFDSSTNTFKGFNGSTWNTL